MTWEQEKMYTQRRAEELKEQMERAIKEGDIDGFLKAYEASARYMKKKQREELYVSFLMARMGYEN